VGFAEVVGERLDPLFDGATLCAEPTVIADQVAISIPSPRWRAALRGGGGCVEVSAACPCRGREDVSLGTADTLDHQRRCARRTVLAQQEAA
jgi:hypothetical protein